MDDLGWLDATAQAELVRSGQCSPVELVEAAIARAEKLNPDLNAIIHPRYERARAEAAAAAGGPFRGVPMVIKDLTCTTEGDPYHAGMRALRDGEFVAPVDSYLARRFRQAGLVSIGRTNVPELGLLPTTEPLAHGPTHNPWKADHSPGGSSGGSAAVVAAGIVALGHANDGGGSIRIPASECGLFGLKPTRGRTSFGPLFGELWGGLECEGVVTRSVRDTAAVLDAIAGRMPGDPYTAPPPARPYASEVGADPGRLRIGLRTEPLKGFVPPHPDCVAAAEDAAKLCEMLGHDVEVASPDLFDVLTFETGLQHFSAVVFSSLTYEIELFGELIGREIKREELEPPTRLIYDVASGTTGPQYVRSYQWAVRLARRAAAWWSEEGFDLLLTPTLPEPPPPLGSFPRGDDDALFTMTRAGMMIQFTVLANLTGQPAMSVPLSWNGAGLPVGVQLVADYGREDLLIRLAAQLEQARPWSERRPPLHA